MLSRLKLTIGALVAMLLSCAPLPAAAHTGSTAYLDIATSDDALNITWRISLRDLDLLIDIDADKNGTLTWDEVQANAGAVQRLATQVLSVNTQSQPCPLTVDAPTHAKDPEHDLAVLTLHGTCTDSVQLTYKAFVGIDENHRALVRLNGSAEPQLLAPGASLNLTPDETPHSFGDLYRTGILHILEGIDHLLFLVALMLPSVLLREGRQWRARTDLHAALMQVIWLATAFTLAHSITLGLAAFDIVRFGPSVIEPLVALTVLAAALNNIWPVVTRRLAWIAFAFGLIHGFAFAEVLAPLHLSSLDMALALLGFNLGVETGQIAVVLSCFAALALMVRWRGYPRWVLQGGSAVVALLACLWIVERVFDLSLIS